MTMMPGLCCAQLYMGAGTSIGAPFATEGGGNYAYPAVGINLHIDYLPARGRVFPSADYTFALVTLPVRSEVFNTLEAVSMFKSYMVQLNYCMPAEGRYGQRFILYGGIGAATIALDYTELSAGGNSVNNVTLVDSGSIYTYPIANVGWKYMRRIKQTSFYFNAAIDVKVVPLLSTHDQYYIPTTTKLYKAEMDGLLLYPAATFGISWMLGEQLWE